jgi:hypothetical protein
LKRLRLVDVSPVSFPAYESTTVYARDGIAERDRLRDQITLARLRAAIDDARAWDAAPAGWHSFPIGPAKYNDR